MRDDLTDFDGTPEEFRDLAAAMRGVRDWLKVDSGWGKAEPIIDPAPAKSDEPGLEKEHREVKRAPSSHSPGYAKLHKCADCDTMLSGAAHRCPEHRRAHRLAKQLAAHRILYRQNKAAMNAEPKMLDGTSGTHLAVAIPPAADLGDGYLK